jgi:ABC-2 type transport system permease protein
VTAVAEALPIVRRRPGVDAVRATFWLGVREIRTALRMPAYFLPGLFIPVFFFFVQVGALAGFAQRAGLTNYKAFQLPVSILFAVTSAGAGLNMVTDIESGYFDKLLATPVSRMAILVGAMGADAARIVFQGLFVTVIALATGMEFKTGVVGAVVATLIGSIFGIAFSALGFGIALRTGNSQATQSTWSLLLPAMFLSTAFAPKSALSGWLRTASTYNPITYVFDAMRSLGLTGWVFHDIAYGLLAAGVLGVVTVSFALRAMMGRIR